MWLYFWWFWCRLKKEVSISREYKMKKNGKKQYFLLCYCLQITVMTFFGHMIRRCKWYTATQKVWSTVCLNSWPPNIDSGAVFNWQHICIHWAHAGSLWFLVHVNAGFFHTQAKATDHGSVLLQHLHKL